MQKTAEIRDHVAQEPQSSSISCLYPTKYPQFLIIKLAQVGFCFLKAKVSKAEREMEEEVEGLVGRGMLRSWKDGGES